MSSPKFNLVQWQEGSLKVHEADVSIEGLSDVLDDYEALFHNLGFNPVVSVNSRTDLPVLKVLENTERKATLFFERK